MWFSLLVVSSLLFQITSLFPFDVLVSCHLSLPYTLMLPFLCTLGLLGSFFFMSFHFSNHDGKSFFGMHSPTLRPRDIILRSLNRTSTPNSSIYVCIYTQTPSLPKEAESPSPYSLHHILSIQQPLHNPAHHVQNIPHPPNPNSHNPLPPNRRQRSPETLD